MAKEIAKFAVCIRKNGTIVESWIETLEWDSLDESEASLKYKYPGLEVGITEYEYL